MARKGIEAAGRADGALPVRRRRRGKRLYRTPRLTVLGSAREMMRRVIFP